MSSIVKNYLISEMSTLFIGTSFNQTERIKEIFQYVDKGISRKIITGLNG